MLIDASMFTIHVPLFKKIVTAYLWVWHIFNIMDFPLPCMSLCKLGNIFEYSLNYKKSSRSCDDFYSWFYVCMYKVAIM